MQAAIVAGGLGHFEYGRVHPMKNGEPNVFEPIACSVERWRLEPGWQLNYTHPAVFPANCRYVRFVVVGS